MTKEQKERRAKVLVCRRCGYDYCICKPNCPDGQVAFAELEATGFYRMRDKRVMAPYYSASKGRNVV